VHRLVLPHGVHQFIVCAERGRAPGGSVSLDHVAHEPVRLRADRNLMPLVSPDEEETSLVHVIAEAITCLLFRSGSGDGPGGL
jgi:hypothetical protein